MAIRNPKENDLLHSLLQTCAAQYP
jgi:hypothetical protein